MTETTKRLVKMMIIIPNSARNQNVHEGDDDDDLTWNCHHEHPVRVLAEVLVPRAVVIREVALGRASRSRKQK